MKTAAEEEKIKKVGKVIQFGFLYRNLGFVFI